MQERICNCRIPKNISLDEINKTIEEYISTMDDEAKVDDATYEQRLNMCAECDGLREGTCKFCGCFVLVRAKRKNKTCPYPANSKWGIVE